MTLELGWGGVLAGIGVLAWGLAHVAAMVCHERRIRRSQAEILRMQQGMRDSMTRLMDAQADALKTESGKEPWEG